MAERGRFITLEGIEGAGKTSQLAAAAGYVESQGRRVITTREPGGTRLGEGVRAVLLDPRYTGMTPEAELLLIFAARAEHVRRVIEPALAQGTWVICDRFTDASYAYQGGGRGMAPERIAILEDWVQGDLRPDLTVLFDLPVQLGLRRAGSRSAADRFEQEQAAFFERVAEAYRARAEAHPERYRILDATAAPEAVENALRGALEGLLSATASGVPGQ
ncbi:dTMP kinase [Ectothiorhodospiraceae bacterium 2226]|nr:dTMP kinase [Ectothiorhodospiraceae bacterium 2226]